MIILIKTSFTYQMFNHTQTFMTALKKLLIPGDFVTPPNNVRQMVLHSAHPSVMVTPMPIMFKIRMSLSGASGFWCLRNKTMV